MINWYLTLSGLMFTFLWFIWTRKNWPNILIKFALFLLVVWSAFLNLKAVGYL